MIYTEFKEIVSDVLKSSEKKDNLSAIHRIICYYFKNVYGGYELQSVIQKYYYQRLFLEIMLAIGKSEKYAEFNETNMKKFNNLITKTILTSKINSYKARQSYYFKWLNRDNIWKWSIATDEILCNLIGIYSKSNEYLEVKKALGLEKTLDQLKKELKNVK